MKLLERDEHLIDDVLKPDPRDEGEDERDSVYDKWDERTREEDRLPKDALEVANFSDVVENWTSWVLDATYFQCRLPEVDGGFVLICLDWDDNWGRWRWECCSAVSGAKSAAEAQRAMIQDYAGRNYDPDVDDEWNAFLKGLLDDLDS